MRNGKTEPSISRYGSQSPGVLRFVEAPDEGKITMAYDLLIKNGRIVDGSGMPSFRGDVGVKDGKITEIGKLSGPAKRTIDVDGRVVAPGFIDNHCHYDAQVTWDPLCSFSCDHGATSVIFGNCSLSLAPVRKGSERRLSEFLSYVEAIPMEVLDTLEFTWETFPEYLDQMDHHLGVNVGNLIGHTAVRYYVMGDDCQKRTATDDEIKQMQGLVRWGSRCRATRGISTPRASTSRQSGLTKRKFSLSPTYCATSAPA
jgi:N-acyl-D-amino-acid deacylase